MEKGKPLSVFMHPRAFWFLKFSGVSRYVCELAHHLEGMGVDVQIPIKETINEYLKALPSFPRMAASACPAPFPIRAMHKILASTPLREKARRMELRYQSIQYMKSHEFDIIHPTHNNAIEILPRMGNKPLVVTVHDMTHELRPSSFPATDPSSYRKRLFVERAQRVIAISECTKNDLVRLFNVNPDKIDVVHHGNSLTLPAHVDHIQMNIPARYVLYVGGRNGYKNFHTFAEAFAKVAAADATIHMVCAGGGAFSEAERQLLHQLGIAERCHQMWVSDDELAVLYHRTECFVYPSEYEGFGLPILEAFECGAPVICSEASCFPEIASYAASYFSTTDSNDLAAKITQVLASPEMRQSLLDNGKKRLADFSWKKTAEKTLETYLKALGR